MFEYGPDGRRRLTKFGQRVVMVILAVAMILLATAWAVAHRQAGESATGIITAGFALAGTLGMGILTFGQSRRNEDILNYQNEQLDQIHRKVETRDEAVEQVVRQAYQETINTMAENAAREARVRHKLEGRNGVLEGGLKHAEDELKAAQIEKARLETEVRELRERLLLLAAGKAGDGDADKGKAAAAGGEC